MRWVGFGTPPTLWKVPKPPVTPAWRFEPSVSSGSSFWPNIMHAMGDHPQKTASDKPETKTATGAAKSASAAVTAKSAASADSKVSRLNALTSNTYQPDAGSAVGSDWVATQVARPAAARKAAETSPTSGTESATQGPAAVTSTSATARRGQQSGGWLRVFSVQPPTDDTAAADAATDRQDLGEDAEGFRRPRGPPTQQYRAEYVIEPPAGGAVIDGPQQFPVQQTPAVPQHRPGRRQPPRRGFMDNMLTRLPASRTAALTAAYLQNPQSGTRRDDDTTSDDDVVELVIEYDNDLEGIVDELLREVRGRSGGGERAAADREPEPAASQLRRRPFTVQQLDQRLGLAHQPYYHIAMALHGLTQGQSRR
ncbi:hypothetical protein FJT64_010100 [Amphibalanus amphitrite]|uniref:Uncharacterized protein n=1 Tax=Amphibalanus amphitrite TaxID=1232801 RepID=A0A6A4VKL5_AMPAM|nr:hypothetical protein FJT64_010100 [Amphibalanus amphitrite]